MSFRFISKIIISLYFLFIISCQSNLTLFENNHKNKNVQSITNKEDKDRIDLSYTNELEDGVIDFYSDETINFDFTNSDFNKIKIKNYGSTLDENIPLNVFIVNLNYMKDLKNFLKLKIIKLFLTGQILTI